MAWDDLERIREQPESLWINSEHTTAGSYDCMSPTQAQTLKSSLLLIKKKNFAVEVGSSTWNGRTKRIYRGKFEHKGTRHNFSLTDPVARRAFEDMEEGGYTFKDV